MSCRIFDNIKCLQTNEPYYVIRLARWSSAARNFNFCTLASIAGVLHTQFITFVNNAYINSSDYSMISWPHRYFHHEIIINNMCEHYFTLILNVQTIKNRLCKFSVTITNLHVFRWSLYEIIINTLFLIIPHSFPNISTIINRFCSDSARNNQNNFF
jgi:hypothetical protein